MKRVLDRVCQDHRPYLVLVTSADFIWELAAGRNVGERQGHQHAIEEILVRLCRNQNRHGRYYLLGLDPGALGPWHNKLFGRLELEAGAREADGDQCRFGGKDKAEKRRTRWITNNELILNQLGVRCVCPYGTHRSGLPRLAPLSWPLSRALCRSMVDSMCFDYAVAMTYRSGRRLEQRAYPVGESMTSDAGSEDEGDEDNEEPDGDDWTWDGEDRLIRLHRVPRRRLFVPFSSTSPPCRFGRILPQRLTIMSLRDGTRREHRDDWTVASWNQRKIEMDFLWTGQTEFELSPEAPDTGEDRPQQPPQPRDPQANPPAMEPRAWDSAAPYDSAVPYEDHLSDYEPSLPRQEAEPGVLEDRAADGSVLPDAGEEPQQQPQPRDPRVLRRRQRTRQLQRGFWSEVHHEGTVDLLEGTLEYVQQEGAGGWVKINLDSDLGKAWKANEGAHADVKLILVSTSARRLKKPQPHLGPADVPLRKSYVLLSGHEALSTDFEQWFNLSPAAQVRPLVAQGRLLYVALFGNELGAEGDGGDPGDDGERGQRQEEQRTRKWQALPRELKLAIKRVHVNLGHASLPSMLLALRISKASETAIKACRLFRCPDCPRLQEPKRPRPSKLPLTDEFNVLIGMDIFQEKDAQGEAWAFLNVICQGTTFQVVTVLGDTFANPTSAAVLEALNASWFSWAGYPEFGIMTDRAKYFLADVAEDLAGHGCYVESAAKASPWQLGQVERHGAIWKSTFRKTVWSNQVAGRAEIMMVTAATNQAKNSLSRKGGFSPAQWVLGRDIRLPASLADDGEVARIGAQALADTPGTKFHRVSTVERSCGSPRERPLPVLATTRFSVELNYGRSGRPAALFQWAATFSTTTQPQRSPGPTAGEA